jgi:LysM repeat protein
VPDPAIERYSSGTTTEMHVVKSGETLSGIAKHYHTTTAALMRENGLRRALIFAGQSLVVSGSSAKSTKHTATTTKKTTTKKKTSTKKTPTKAPTKTPAKTSTTKKSPHAHSGAAATSSQRP